MDLILDRTRMNTGSADDCNPLFLSLASSLSDTELAALSFLLPLSKDYPDIISWYISKVVPGLKNGTRKMILIERNDVLVGIGIAKNDSIERKICTVRVANNYFGRGLGLRIFDALLKWLDYDQPHFTINENKLRSFERIFEYYHFKRTSINRGLYLPYQNELGYNDDINKTK